MKSGEALERRLLQIISSMPSYLEGKGRLIDKPLDQKVSPVS